MSSLDGFTDTTASSLGGTFGNAGLVQQAYDRMVEFQLRDEPLLRQLVDKKPGRQAMPGSTVSLQIYKDLDITTDALDEVVDPDIESIKTPNIVNLVMQERGKVAMSTIRLGALTLADSLDSDIATLIARNMADSVDRLVLDAILEGTNVRNAGGGLDATGTIEAADVRFITSKLRGNKASGRKGNLFYAAIHPDVSHDLRAENAGANWRDPHTYQDTANIYNGEIGTFEGAFFVESARLAPTAGVYPTVFAGKQAIAEVAAIEPHVVLGAVVDPLKRKQPIGWHGILAHGVYRNEALYRVESSSSIAD